MKPGQLIAVALGVGLMVAPAVLGYSESPAADFHRSLGPAAVTFGTIALWEATRDVRLANVVAGAALMLAPLFGGHDGTAAAVGVTAGAVLAVSARYGGRVVERRGRGWRGVLVEARVDAAPLEAAPLEAGSDR